MIDKIGSSFRAYAPLVLRMGLAVIIVMMGAEMLTDRYQTVDRIVGGVLILCGVLVLIGFMTRWAAAGLVALVIFQVINDLGADIFLNPNDHLWLAVMAMSLSVYCSGGGEMSVDLRKKRKEEK